MRNDDIRGTIERLGVLRGQIEAIEWDVMIDAPEALESAVAIIETLSETNQRLNRRCQLAEQALGEYRRMIAPPPDGDGIRFVSGSFGRALLAYHCDQLEDENAQLRQDHEAMNLLRSHAIDCVHWCEGTDKEDTSPACWMAYQYGAQHWMQADESRSDDPAETILKAAAAIRDAPRDNQPSNVSDHE